MFINCDDDPFDDKEPKIPETYDSDDENYNPAVIANRDDGTQSFFESTLMRN